MNGIRKPNVGGARALIVQVYYTGVTYAKILKNCEKKGKENNLIYIFHQHEKYFHLYIIQLFVIIVKDLMKIYIKMYCVY
jgi:hypothetical protein